jgi:hypothetical protein
VQHLIRDQARESRVMVNVSLPQNSVKIFLLSRAQDAPTGIANCDLMQ